MNHEIIAESRAEQSRAEQSTLISCGLLRA